MLKSGDVIQLINLQFKTELNRCIGCIQRSFFDDDVIVKRYAIEIRLNGVSSFVKAKLNNVELPARTFGTIVWTGGYKE
jgi:hypothetical protein